MKTLDDRMDAIEETLTVIKDNHLHHIAKDVEVMKVKIEAVDERVGLLESLMRDNFNRIVLGLLVIAGAAIGVDMMGVMSG